MREFFDFIKNHILISAIVLLMSILTLIGYVMSVVTLAREEQPDVLSYVNQNVFAGVAIHNIKEGLVGPDGVLKEMDVTLLQMFANDTQAFGDDGDNSFDLVQKHKEDYSHIYKEHKKIEINKEKPSNNHQSLKPKKVEKKQPEKRQEDIADLEEESQDTEEPKVDDFALVPCEADNNYFMDALFLGDSRVVGLGAFSNLPNITVYAVKSFQIYKLEDKALIKTELGNITIPQALLMQENKYKKVYLKFGLNEIGMDEAKFDDYYYKLIDLVKYTQKDAIVYVQSVIHVSTGKDADPSYITNARIDARNEHLKKIAEDEGVVYLDLNEVFTDENNALPDGLASDGVHLKAQNIKIWTDYLKAHAYRRNSWEEKVYDHEYTGNELPYIMNYYMPDGSAPEDDSGDAKAVAEDGEVITVHGGTIEKLE